MRKNTKNTEPTLVTSPDNEPTSSDQIKYRRSKIAGAGLLAAGVAFGATALFGGETSGASKELQAAAPASAPAFPTEKTAPSTSEQSTPATTPETTPPSPSASAGVEKTTTFEVPSKLNASNVKFELANSQVLTGTEALAEKLRIAEKSGMTNKTFAGELYKKIGLGVNINTSPQAAKAYASTDVGSFGKGLNGVMKGYVDNGAAADAFGEGGYEITDYMSGVNAYNRERTKATGVEHGCVYSDVTLPAAEVGPLQLGEQVDMQATEKCGELGDDGKLKTIERERDVWIGATVGEPTDGKTYTFKAADVRTMGA